MPQWTVTLPPVTLPAAKTFEEGVFGRDVAFENGDYVLTPSGDYGTVGGERNVRASLLRRWLAAPNSFRLRPGYGAGVGELANRPLTTANQATVANSIREQAVEDRRVRRAEATVTRQGIDVARVVVKAQLRQVRGRSLGIEFSIRSTQ